MFISITCHQYDEFRLSCGRAFVTIFPITCLKERPMESLCSTGTIGIISLCKMCVFPDPRRYPHLFIPDRRQFKEAAKERYFKNQNLAIYFHSSIAEYFMGTWGGGNPKPFKYTEIQRMRYKRFEAMNHLRYFVIWKSFRFEQI